MDVRLPRLGEGADTGTISTIFVKEGDAVKKDQPILELESEKAVATIPSPAGGTITEIHVKEGDEIKVGQMILSLSENGAAVAAAPPRTIDATVGDEEPLVQEASPRTATEPEAGPVELPEPVPVQEPLTSLAPPPASPSLRKIARELGIDLRRVRGSQRGGRVVMADLRNYVTWLQQVALARKTPAPGQAAPTPAGPERIDFSAWGRVETKKMATLRRTISARMTESWTTIPHVTQFDEADVSDLLALRKKYAPKYEKKGGHLTLTSFVVKALVGVLKKFPLFNASLDDATGEIVYKYYYHFGIAVDTDQGLIVPVLRDVDRKSLLEVSVELNALAERTRNRKVALDEMRGGSFTISNQGGIGSGHFTPIIHKPEVAILGMGRGVTKLVPHEAKVRQRVMLPLSLSYDHRIIDGADAARFMVELVRTLEEFKESDAKI